VFLFDEPLSNLDAKMRVQMRTEISKLHQQLQATMIYVTHDQIEAMTMGDRIVVMKDGVIQQIDEPLKLYNNPVNRFVAGFLGSPPMNFINGVLEGAPDGVIFRELKGGEIECKFIGAVEAREFIGKDVVLGIRAEHLEVIAGSIGPEACRFPAIVDMVEPMGAETNIYLHTGAHTLVCRTEDQFTHGAVGQRFDLEMNVAKAYLFDPVSDQRLL
jgi:multiple sugar transport system ATP-binding protein